MGLAPVVKKIAITGTTPSRMQAPFDDPDWHFMTIGPGGHDVTRWNDLFEVHGPSTWPKEFGPYLENLKAVQPPKRIFTMVPVPEFSANVVMPRERWFRTYGKCWFSSSIAYAIAQAVDDEVTDLGFWGIDFEAGEEYRVQWVGARHFIDMLHSEIFEGGVKMDRPPGPGRIRMHFPAGCGLLRDPTPYPDRWETHGALMVQQKLDFLRGQLAQKQFIHSDLMVRIHHIEGRVAAITDGETKELLPQLAEDLKKLHDECGATAAVINQLIGSIDFAEFFRSRSMIGNPGE